MTQNAPSKFLSPSKSNTRFNKFDSGVTPRRHFLFLWGNRAKGGFSYLEILITIMIVAVFFLPCMEMFSASVAHLGFVGDMNTALSLAREGMERVRNLRMSETQLATRGSQYEPPLEDPPLELNAAKWRIFQKIEEGTDPLKVRVFVYKDDILEHPLVELATLFEDVD